MDSPAHKANQMDDDVMEASYVVMYVPYEDGSKLTSAIATLNPFSYVGDDNATFEGSGMQEMMTEEEYNMLVDYFRK